MCGIVGVCSERTLRQDDADTVARMVKTIAHRGPDSEQMVTPHAHVTVGFRRLAIRDLDDRANQPMHSASGRTCVVFNGEIYNTDELCRRFCSDAELRTTGDTEVLLEAFERHGETIFEQCNGMFAAAFVDVSSGHVTLVRDRMGMKPLYLFQGADFIAFGSELRSLRVFDLQIDETQASFYFHFGYLPSPRTFFRQTTQLLPGQVVRLRDGRVISRSRFYDFSRIPWGDEPRHDKDRLDELVSDAIAIRQLSDVPVGAFLSGGVDSGLIASHLSNSNVPAFTVQFSESKYDESDAARETAKHLRLDHQSIPLSVEQLERITLDYLDCYEQPYTDTSGLVTMLLCRVVKDHVTVALAGDGGDEFYGGYVRYEWLRKAAIARRFPGYCRRLFGRIASTVEPSRGSRISRWLRARDTGETYAEILRGWNATSASELLPGHAVEEPVDFVRTHFRSVDADPLSQAASFDAAYYIPDMLQPKIDRASMRVSLEVRCPLLDYRVAEYGARLATKTKYKHGPKSVLRQLYANRLSERGLPATLVSRPKQGFSVPLSKWMRGPLRNLVNDSIRARKFRDADWLNQDVVTSTLDEFMNGRVEYAHSVWMLFSLARTVQSQVESTPAARAA